MQEKIELVDFKGKFAEYFMKWTLDHKDEIEKDELDEQELYYDLYDKWLEKANSEFGGKAPKDYFEDAEDKRLLLSALIDYIKQGISVPDPLVNSIVRHGDETYPIILSILMNTDIYEDLDPDTVDEIRAECVSLIWDMGKEHPYLRYAELLVGQEEDSKLAEILCEILMDRDGDVLDRLYEGYEKAGTYARTCIIDILSSHGDERAKELIKEELLKGKLDKLFLCSKLMMYNDPEASLIIKNQMSSPDNDYYAYRELRNMYEELTGEILDTEDFSGDPTYEVEKYIFEEEDDEK